MQIYIARIYSTHKQMISRIDQLYVNQIYFFYLLCEEHLDLRHVLLEEESFHQSQLVGEGFFQLLRAQDYFMIPEMSLMTSIASFSRRLIRLAEPSSTVSLMSHVVSLR